MIRHDLSNYNEMTHKLAFYKGENMNKKKISGIKFSIFMKLFLVSLAFVVVPVAIIGTTSILQFSNSIKSQTVDHMERKVEDKKKLLQTIVEGQKSEANAIAHDSISQKSLKELKAGEGEIPNDQLQQVRAYLESFNDADKYQNLFFTDWKGTIVADSTQGKSEGVDVSEREYFTKARDSKEPVVSDVIVSVTDGEVVMVVTVPLFDENKEFIGIMGISVYFTPLTDRLIQRADGEEYNYIVFNQDGSIIAHEQKDFVFNLNFREGNASEQQVYQKMQQKPSSVESYFLDDTEKTMAYTTYDENQWVVACSISVKDYMHPIFSLIYKIAFIIIASVGVAIVFVFLFSRSISKPLKKLANTARKIADGDLTMKAITYKGKDEIGLVINAFDDMVNQLSTVIQSVQEMSEHTLDASENMKHASEEANEATLQIATSVNELAKGSTELARHAENGNDKIVTFTLDINDIVKEMSGSKELSDTARQSVEEGKKSITYQAKKMKDNKEVVNKVSSSIQIMSQKSKEMEEILGVIMGISEQTNLLSLNASIEAARAGEHGRGFAVVAQEIGQLAEQSGISVRRINDMIAQVQESVENAVRDMNESIIVVNKQEEAMNLTVTAFGQIEEVVSNINTNITNVASLAAQMDKKAKETGQIMEEIASVSQESAAGTEEVAASTQEQSAIIEQISTASIDLAKMAQKLQESIAIFNI